MKKLNIQLKLAIACFILLVVSPFCYTFFVLMPLYSSVGKTVITDSAASSPHAWSAVDRAQLILHILLPVAATLFILAIVLLVVGLLKQTNGNGR